MHWPDNAGSPWRDANGAVAGLATITVAIASFHGLDVTSGFGAVTWRLAVLGVGMGLTMAPATESIMGSLPLARAGVGSAVNDTTRELGGAVGVAVIGSVFSSVYVSRIVDALHGRPGSIVAGAKGSVGAALAIASRLPGAAGDVDRAGRADGFRGKVSDRPGEAGRPIAGLADRKHVI